MKMKIEITRTQWTVIKCALEAEIADFRQTAALDTATEDTREILLKAAERREQALKELQEQVKDYE